MLVMARVRKDIESRGHILGVFESLETGGHGAACKKCGGKVLITDDGRVAMTATLRAQCLSAIAEPASQFGLFTSK